MTDTILETTRKPNPPLRLLVGVFILSMIAAGTLIFVLVQALLPEQGTTLVETAMVTTQRTDGVRTVDPPRTVSDFTLPSHTGEPLSLSELQGQPTLVYFGYTHCPDVCPLTLNDMQQARELLGEAGDDLHYLFVSVDGERDNVDRFDLYFKARGVEDFMLGMSGEPNTLNRVSPDYNLIYELQEADETGYYAVDHTSSLFLLDAEGRLTRIFAYGTAPDVIAEEIQELL
jgi:protein SCO1/2